MAMTDATSSVSGNDSMGIAKKNAIADQQKPHRTFTLPKSSPFRFIEGKSVLMYEDLKNLSMSVANESNGFECNSSFLAFSLAGAGGRIGFWKVEKQKTRLPFKIPSIVCGAELCDFKFDPFVSNRIVTATEDGKLKLWIIPFETNDDLLEPTLSWNAHKGRCSFILFHPRYSNILLSVFFLCHQKGITRTWPAMCKALES
jgi:WD40 repeat protein